MNKINSVFILKWNLKFLVKYYDITVVLLVLFKY